jgi:hypothetical protein
MWISILLKIIISFIIIFIGHQLFIYLKETYSVKKTKDLVGSQIIKYKTILQNIQNNEQIVNEKANSNEISENACSQIIQYKNPEYSDLKNDLENFLLEIQ